MSRRRLRVGVAVAVLAGAFAFVLAHGVGSALDFYETVGQALASRRTLGASTFDLEGIVVPGSVHESRFATSFELEGSTRRGAPRVAVVAPADPPALFAPGIPVVVVGRFAGPGTRFVASQVMVKHSSTYIARHPGRVVAPDGSVR
jgi:cytochrome c-type biogenesis protein CcmE